MADVLTDSAAMLTIDTSAVDFLVGRRSRDDGRRQSVKGAYGRYVR